MQLAAANRPDLRHPPSRIPPSSATYQPSPAGALFHHGGGGSTKGGFPSGYHTPPAPRHQPPPPQSNGRSSWQVNNTERHFNGGPLSVPPSNTSGVHGLASCDMDVDMESHGLVPPPPFNAGQGHSAVMGHGPMEGRMNLQGLPTNQHHFHPQQQPPLQQGHNVRSPPDMIPTGIPGQYQPTNVDPRAWQQNQYMGGLDSAIGSMGPASPIAVQTPGPPVAFGTPDCAGLDRLAINGNYTDGVQPNFPVEQIQGLPAVPGTGHPNSEISLADLVSYLFTEEDLDVATKSMEVAFTVAKNDCARLVREPQIVPAMIRVVDRFSMDGVPNALIAHKALSAFQLFSNVTEWQLVLLEPQVLDFLLRMLHHSQHRLVHNLAITIIYSLIASTDVNINLAVKAWLFDHDAIRIMMPFLQNGDLTQQQITCDCFTLMSLGNDRVKVVILEQGGLQTVLNLLHSSSDFHLLDYVRGLLKTLSTEARNKAAIIQHNGIAILVDDIQRQVNAKSSAVTNSLLILRNLCDVLAMDKVAGRYDYLLELLVRLLDQHKTGRIPVSTIYAAAILGNMLANNDANKHAVFRMDCMPRLLSICRNLPSNRPSGDITEPVMLTLRTLTAGGKAGKERACHLVERGGLQVLIELMSLRPNIHFATVKAVLGVIKNVAIAERYVPELYNFGLVDSIRELLWKLINFPKTWNEDGNWNFDVLPGSESVDPKDATPGAIKRYEIIGGSLEALSVIMRDENVRAQFINRIVGSPGGDTWIIRLLVNGLRLPDHYAKSCASLLDLLITPNQDGSVSIRKAALEFNALNALKEIRDRFSRDNLFVKMVTGIMGPLSSQLPTEYQNSLQLELPPQPMMPTDFPPNNFAGSDYQYGGDSYQHYANSGPPSVYGSVYSTTLSVPSSDLLTDFDSQPGPSTMYQQSNMWDQSAGPPPLHNQPVPGPSQYEYPQQRAQGHRSDMQQPPQTGIRQQQAQHHHQQQMGQMRLPNGQHK